MKKQIQIILMIILFLCGVVNVNAGGSGDDDTMAGSHMNINCVYENKNVTSNELNSGKYVNFEFVGIDAIMPGTMFTYSFGNISVEGKFEKNYEYHFSSGCKTCGRWLNYDSKYGSEYWLQAWWQNQMMDDNLNTLPGSEIQKKADNGDFCPEQIMVTQRKKDSAYFFVSCRDDNDCSASKKELEKDGIYKNTKTFHFTGTSLAISNINQETYEDTNAAEKIEEGKEKVEDYCNENSLYYNESKCAESKIVNNATQDTANNIISYDPNAKVELEKINLNKVTCATIFKDSNGNYNTTHGLLKISIKFIQYLAVILASVLSIVDFIKVVPTQDKDMLRKSTMKAATRLGIAIAIFLVPVLLKFILEIIGISDPLCGLI